MVEDRAGQLRNRLVAAQLLAHAINASPDGMNEAWRQAQCQSAAMAGEVLAVVLPALVAELAPDRGALAEAIRRDIASTTLQLEAAND